MTEECPDVGRLEATIAFLDVKSDPAESGSSDDYCDVDFDLPYLGDAEDVAFVEDLASRLSAEAAKVRTVGGMFVEWGELGDQIEAARGPVWAACGMVADGMRRVRAQEEIGQTLRQRWPHEEIFEEVALPIGYEAPYTSCESGHVLRVLDCIGQAHESEMKSLISQYEPLTKTDLPLHGTVDAQRVQDVLDSEYPWATDLNGLACELLALAAAVGKAWFWVPPLLLAGDPGTGKTRWARRLAEIGGVGFECFPDGGDRLAVSGQQRSWRGAEPCGAIKAMAKLQTANPLICVDEIDKAARHPEMGSAQDALLPFLERGSASRHRDPCLEGNLDARWVSWILTANDLSMVSDPLLNRCRVLHMPLPRSCDFDVLVNGVLRDVAKQWQCAPERLPELPPASVDRLRKRFNETLVPRRLRVDVESALAKAATGREWTLNDRLKADGRQRIGFC